MYTYKYPRPAITVDAAVLCYTRGEIHILLIQRKNDPYRGSWALPGGFIEMNERLIDAAKRELEEETGLRLPSLYFLDMYDTPDRDPRGRTISAVFLAFLETFPDEVKAGDDACKTRWFSLETLPSLAFDHGIIISDVKRMIHPDSDT